MIRIGQYDESLPLLDSFFNNNHYLNMLRIMQNSSKAETSSLKRFRKPKMTSKFEKLLLTDRPKHCSSHKKVLHLPPLQSLSDHKKAPRMVRHTDENQEDEGRWAEAPLDELYQSIEFKLQQTGAFPQVDDVEYAEQAPLRESNTLGVTFGRKEQHRWEDSREHTNARDVVSSFRLGHYDEVFKAGSFRSRQELPLAKEAEGHRLRTPQFRRGSANNVRSQLPPLPPLASKCL